MPTTARWALPYPALADPPDASENIGGLAFALDDAMLDNAGPLASRPVSTPANPGEAGRFYYASDEQELYRDIGSGWERVSTRHSAMRARLTVSQLCPGLVWTTLLTNTVEYDSDGLHIPGPSPRTVTRFPGLYELFGAAVFSANGTGQVRLLRFLRNGNTVVAEGGQTGDARAGGTIRTEVARHIVLAPNDYLELQAYHDVSPAPQTLQIQSGNVSVARVAGTP